MTGVILIEKIFGKKSDIQYEFAALYKKASLRPPSLS